MKRMGKISALAIALLLVVSSVMIVGTVSAAVPKPSVPDFTVQLVSHPYDVAPTSTINPYTGETVITKKGYHVENRTIEITITNQPYTFSFKGITYEVYYNVRVKGHYEQDWTELYAPFNRSINSHYDKGLYITDVPQSTSDFTVISLAADYDFTVFPYLDYLANYYDDFQLDAELDIQVQAVVGHDWIYWVTNHLFGPEGHWENAVALDDVSDWSGTQTIAINKVASASSPDPSPSSSSTINQHDAQTGTIFVLQIALVVFALAVAGLVAVVVVLWRKRSVKQHSTILTNASNLYSIVCGSGQA